MANEAQVNISLFIQKADDSGRVLLEYNGRPAAFTADVNGAKGPSPGAITVTPAGVSVDLSQFTTPGLCRLMNQDGTNFVEFGILVGTEFYPLGEVQPGESYVIRLSRNLGQSFESTGTSSLGSTSNFYLRSYNQTCNVLVEAFEA